MSNLLKLQCPTCGAQLAVAADQSQFACGHCNNQYLLDRTLAELSPAEREKLRATVTYTHKLGQWLHIADYEVFLHSLTEETIDKKRVLYIDVAYRNTSAGPLTCRYDQWIVFDRNGYTYEAVRDFDMRAIYEGNAKRYLGMSRIITPTMQLRGWLGFLIPSAVVIDYLQFSGGAPAKTVEFRITLES